MKKLAYFNKNTQQIKKFSRVKALTLGSEWEFIPRIENYLDEDGKHHVRLHFEDFTADIVETDESIEANAKGQSIVSGVEVVGDGNKNAK